MLASFKLEASLLTITSNPESCDVKILNSATGKFASVGKTPYTADLKNLKGPSGSDKMMQITVEKIGFIPFNIVIPLLGSIDVKLKANLEVEKDIKYAADFDMLVGDLFDVLRMMRVKDYTSAVTKLSMLEKKFPHFSIVHEMKGSAYYLNKEYKKALNYYRKAFAQNPKNREAYRMKIYLEKKFNIGRDT